MLIKRGDEFSDAMWALEPDDRVELSTPIGDGYPVETARGCPLWLVGVGTGVAALRPVVRTVVADRPAFGDVAAEVVFVCGMRGMVDGVRATAAELGIDVARVHTND